jgi:cyclomaltodextrinase / maltogenic alpha-amylase / neopullulanase
MSRPLFAASLAFFFCAAAASAAPAAPAGGYANQTDQALAGVFAAREADWRNGAIVYQVLVDRFAPSAKLDGKRTLYASPKILRRWDETPKRGTYLPEIKLWSHEIEFWGGDLESVTSKLDYVQALGADVLYLNPIHLGYTNHKYDALDYHKVSPEFGTRDDVKKLASNVHRRRMKLVLDGVFNHMGRNSAAFKDAESNPKSVYRDWFYFGPQYPGGARSWALAQNLPELNLENPKVRAHVFAERDSVVQSYLIDGVDGWRLDVAFDMGFRFLGDLTRAAHLRKPGSLVVGEIANYPKEWFPAVDAVMNFTLREIIIRTVKGEIDAKTSQQMIARLIEEAGIEPMLKSWTMLDNHDTFRLATVLPDDAHRRMAQLLQFTLPGSPNLYYGSEIGMTGGDDPEMRAPMRWDWVRDDNAALAWTRQLIALRKAHRALRVGNFRLVNADKLIAFERYTDRIEDSVVVIANPGKQDLKETILVPNSKLMNGAPMINLLDKNAKPVAIVTALLEVTVPAGGLLVLKPDVKAVDGYTSYKRVQ